MEKEKPIVPKVGMGCTLSSGSDSYAYMVVKVIDAKKQHVLVSRAKMSPNKAQWPEQEHDYSIDPNAKTIELETYHGHLREVYVDPVTHRRRHKEWLWYSHFSIGIAVDYLDPSF